MATIAERKRKDGTLSYLAQIIKREGGKTIHNESKTFTTRKQAEAWSKKREREIKEALLDGRTVTKQADHGKTLKDAIKAYLADNKKPVGRTKQQVLNTILNEYDLVKIRCDRITAKNIIDFADQISQRKNVESASTVLNYLSHLSKVFELSKSIGYPLDYNEYKEALVYLAHKGKTAKSKNRTRRPTIDEMNKLMEFFDEKSRRHPQSAPMHRIIAFALFSTRRQEEVLKIRWEDFDPKSKTVLVRDMKDPRNKDGNHMRVELPDPCCAIIAAMPKKSRDPERIFPYGTDAISAAFTRACKFLEIEDLRFHDLRHEGTSRLFEMGRTIPQAATVTGHRSWQSLQRYTHDLTFKGDRWENWKWIKPIT